MRQFGRLPFQNLQKEVLLWQSFLYHRKAAEAAAHRRSKCASLS